MKNWDVVQQLNFRGKTYFLVRETDENGYSQSFICKDFFRNLYITESYKNLNNFTNIEKTPFLQYREDVYGREKQHLLKIISPNLSYTNDIIKHHSKNLYGLNNFLCDFIDNRYDDVDIHHSQNVMILDIETTGKCDVEEKPMNHWKPECAMSGVSLIQLLFVNGNDKQLYIIGNKKYEKQIQPIHNIQPKYVFSFDEMDMFVQMKRLMDKHQPHIITGWNIDNYDIPYLIHRYYRLHLFQNGMPKNHHTALKDAAVNFHCVQFFSHLAFNEFVHSVEKAAIKIVENEDIVNIKQVNPFDMIDEWNGANWLGYNIIDYMSLYKKQTSNLASLASYSLDFVCNYELKDGKVDYGIDETLYSLYESDYNKFIEYGIKDVILVLRLDEKMKFLNLIQNLAYICRVPLQYVKFNSILINALIYHNAKKSGTILKYKGDVIDDKQAESSKAIGGFIHFTQNRWDWVTSLDFASLYPSIISWANIGGDTHIQYEQLPPDLKNLVDAHCVTYSKDDDVENVQNKHYDFVKDVLLNPYKAKMIQEVLKKYDVSLTPNGKCFKRNKQAIFAQSEDELVANRKQVKKLFKQKEKEYEDGGRTDQNLYKEYTAYDTQQVALKVICNGGYGVLSLPNAQFAGNYIDYSNSVTSSGQCIDLICAFTASNIMSTIAKTIFYKQNMKKDVPRLKHITTMDTDSFYLSCDAMIESYFKGFDKQKTSSIISKFINDVIQPELRYTLDYTSDVLNAKNPQKLVIDREIIADKFISVGAKNYYCRIFDSEGTILKTPKMKIKGLAVVKTSMPDFFQEKMTKEVLNVIMDNKGDTLNDRLVEIKQSLIELMKTLNPLTLSKKMSVSSLDYIGDENSEISVNSKLERINDDGKTIPVSYNARAAILHNRLVKMMNINIREIESGDKIMILPINYRKDLCPIKYNYIAFKNPNFLTETNLINYIDYDKIIKDYFNKNVELILEPLDEHVDIKIKTKKTPNMKMSNRKNTDLTTKTNTKKKTPEDYMMEYKFDQTLLERLQTYQNERIDDDKTK